MWQKQIERTKPIKKLYIGQKGDIRPHVLKPLQCKYAYHQKSNSNSKCTFHASRYYVQCISCGQHHQARLTECSFCHIVLRSRFYKIAKTETERGFQSPVQKRHTHSSKRSLRKSQHIASLQSIHDYNENKYQT